MTKTLRLRAVQGLSLGAAAMAAAPAFAHHPLGGATPDNFLQKTKYLPEKTHIPTPPGLIAQLASDHPVHRPDAILLWSADEPDHAKRKAELITELTRLRREISRR